MPTTNVTRSGVATALLLSALDNGLPGDTLNVRCSLDVQLFCSHGEGKFEGFPHSANAPSFHNRFDNIHHVFRTFGMNAGATAAARGHHVRSIMDTRVQYFSASMANGYSPALSINLDDCISALQYDRQLVLTEQSFIERIRLAFVNSLRWGSWHETAGITCWRQLSLDKFVPDCLQSCCPVPRHKILVVVLTSFGEM